MEKSPPESHGNRPDARLAPAFALATRHGTIDMRRRTAVMGIVNVTPDSFSDGGKYFAPERAVARGEEFARSGADLVDIGGESTRPGAAPVSAEDEIARVVPVIRALRRKVAIPISIDTTKSQVARAALDEGADLVNDISALGFDPAMAALVAAERVPVVLMHMQGTPRTMQQGPAYKDVLEEVKSYLQRRIEFAMAAGVEADRIIVDPGIGFGKNLEHNLALVRGLSALAGLGRPVLVGTSRKTFIGKLLGAGPEERLEGSLAAAVATALAGANMIRVHDVKEAARAVRVADALRYGADAPAGAEP
jgi:dihydropteroate synthase